MKKFVISMLSVFMTLGVFTTTISADTGAQDVTATPITESVVDKSELIELIDKAEEILSNRDKYVPESLEDIEEYLGIAKDFADENTEVDQDTYDGLVEGFKEMVEAAEEKTYDTSELQKYYDLALEIKANEENYVPESIADLIGSLDGVKMLLDSPETFGQETIDLTLVALKELVEGATLVEGFVDKSKLENAIKQAKDQINSGKKFEEEGLKELEEALVSALEVFENDTINHPLVGELDVDQDLVDGTTETLLEYIDALVEIELTNEEKIEEMINGLGAMLFDGIFNINTDNELLSGMMGGYEDESVGSYEFLKESWTWFDTVRDDLVEYKSTNSFNGDHAYGYYLKNDVETNKTIFLAHGYRSNLYQDPERLFVAPKAKSFIDAGYNVMFLNAAAHKPLGAELPTEPKYTNFGVHDRDLYLEILNDFVTADDEIYLYGESMGAATVLMMAELDLPTQVKGIIADSSFTDLGTLMSTIKGYATVEGAGGLVITIINDSLGALGGMAINALGIKEEDTLITVIDKVITLANKGGLIGGVINGMLVDLGIDPAVFKDGGFKEEYLDDVFEIIMNNFNDVIGVDVYDVSPLTAIQKNTTIPMLFMHNEGDMLIPSPMTEVLYSESPLDPAYKRVVIFEGGNHCTSHSDNHELHTNAVLNFIEDTKLSRKVEELKETLVEAKAVDAKLYTDASYAKLALAIDEAEALISRLNTRANNVVTVEEVDTAIANLNTAMTGLELKAEESIKPETPKDEGKTETPKTEEKPNTGVTSMYATYIATIVLAGFVLTVILKKRKAVK